MLHCAILDSAGLWLRLIVMTCIIVAEFCRYAASPPRRVPRTPRHVVVASRSPRASTPVCAQSPVTFFRLLTLLTISHAMTAAVAAYTA